MYSTNWDVSNSDLSILSSLTLTFSSASSVIFPSIYSPPDELAILFKISLFLLVITTSPLLSFLYESILPLTFIGIVEPLSCPTPIDIRFILFSIIKLIKLSGISSWSSPSESKISTLFVSEFWSKKFAARFKAESMDVPWDDSMSVSIICKKFLTDAKSVVKGTWGIAWAAYATIPTLSEFNEFIISEIILLDLKSLLGATSSASILFETSIAKTISTPSLLIEFNSVPIFGFARPIDNNNIARHSKINFKLSLKFDRFGLIISNNSESEYESWIFFLQDMYKKLINIKKGIINVRYRKFGLSNWYII